MRRVVFDCDRCGKRDLTEVYGLYNREGEGEENLLGDEERFEQVTKVGHKAQLVEALTFGTLRSLEEGLGWVHYCRRCFMTVSDNLAKIANIKKPVKVKPRPGLPAEDDPSRNQARRAQETIVEPELAPVAPAIGAPSGKPLPQEPSDPSRNQARRAQEATVASKKAKPKAKAKAKAKAKTPAKKKTSGDLPLTRGPKK